MTLRERLIDWVEGQASAPAYADVALAERVSMVLQKIAATARGPEGELAAQILDASVRGYAKFVRDVAKWHDRWGVGDLGQVKGRGGRGGKRRARAGLLRAARALKDALR